MEDIMEKKAKRESKDSVFKSIFSDPAMILDAYRLWHPEDTTVTVDDIRTVTLENVLTTGRNNDLGFLVRGNLLFLAESQSKWSLNILPRVLVYAAETMSRYFMGKDSGDIYSGRKIHLPRTEAYVLFTGKGKRKKEYTLTDEFFDGVPCAVDVRVKVITKGDKGNVVWEYIAFCRELDKMRVAYKDNPRHGIMMAIQNCIEKDILKDYLERNEGDVMTIMENLYDQELNTERMFRQREKISEERALQKGDIRTTVRMCRKFGLDKAATVDSVMNDLLLPKDKASAVVEKYWNYKPKTNG